MELQVFCSLSLAEAALYCSVSSQQSSGGPEALDVCLIKPYTKRITKQYKDQCIRDVNYEQLCPASIQYFETVPVHNVAKNKLSTAPKAAQLFIL